MAEPLGWIAIAEGAARAGEALGVLGGAAEVGAGTGLVAEAVAGGSAAAVGMDAVGGAALGASSIGAAEATLGTGLATAAVIGSEAAASSAGAATFDTIFASAAAEAGLASEGVVGAEVAQSATWAERAGSLATKVGTGAKTVATTAGKVSVGTVATVKAAPYVYGAGDVGYRVMTGEGVDEAVVNTAGDIAKLGAKAAGFGLEQFLEDIDPSILIMVGFGAYYYLIGNP